MCFALARALIISVLLVASFLIFLRTPFAYSRVLVRVLTCTVSAQWVHHSSSTEPTHRTLAGVRYSASLCHACITGRGDVTTEGSTKDGEQTGGDERDERGLAAAGYIRVGVRALKGILFAAPSLHLSPPSPPQRLMNSSSNLFPYRSGALPLLLPLLLAWLLSPGPSPLLCVALTAGKQSLVRNIDDTNPPARLRTSRLHLESSRGEVSLSIL